MSILENSYPQLEVDWKIRTVPNKEQCVALWDKYGMLQNIRAHSELVAEFARAMARRINEVCPNSVNEDFVYAAGMLHDIAKTWTVRNGGSHQQIGSSIIRMETNDFLLASCVLHHVIWPWEEGILSLENNILHPPLIIAYADKRVMHDNIVSLDKRFSDLFERYATTEEIRKNIQINFDQAKKMELCLSKKMEFDLNACTLISGLLVARS